MTDSASRRLTRRRFLKRSATVSAAAALPAFLAACGDDATVLAGAAVQAQASATPTAIATTGPVIDPDPATATASADPEPTEAQAEAVTPTPVVDPTPNPIGSLAVEFTYTMQSGGKQLNPYIAVWIEDPDGNSLRTIALWLEQSNKGTKWLDDVIRWWRGDQARLSSGGAEIVEAVSSATRAPGSYALLWDGLDDSGAPVALEQVVLCIESARERGPHSLICVEVDRAGLGDRLDLHSDGELSAATVSRV